MKNFTHALFFLAISFLQQKTFGQWWQTNLNVGASVNCIGRVGINIWAGTSTGVYSSNDEGQTWQKLQMLDGAYCAGIYSDSNFVMIVYEGYSNYPGSGTNLMVTTSYNAGGTWNTPVYVDGNRTYKPTIVQASKGSLYFIMYDYYYYSADSGITWQITQPTFANEYLSRIDANPNFCFASGGDINVSGYTYFFCSSDGLNTWQQLRTDIVDYTVRDFKLVDSSFIISVRDQGISYPAKILHSADLGITWDTTVVTGATQIDTFAIDTLGNVYFAADSLNTHYYYYSTDKGATWNETLTPPAVRYGGIKLSTGNYLQLHPTLGIANYSPVNNSYVPSSSGIANQRITAIFSNKNILYAGGPDGFFKSSNGGITWQTIDGTFKDLSDMLFLGDTIFAANVGSIKRSFDNGVTWNNTSTKPFAYSFAAKGARIYLSCFFSDVYYSDDFGNNWTLMPEPLATGGILAVFNNQLYSYDSFGVLSVFDEVNQVWNDPQFYSSAGAGPYSLKVVDNYLVAEGSDGIWATTDVVTWAASSGLFGLTSLGGVWFATDLSNALYESFDKGVTWQILTNTYQPFLINCTDETNTEFRGNMLAFAYNNLYAGTSANGVWQFGTSYGTSSGNVYYDINGNGQRDSTERGLAGVVVYNETNNIYATTDADGNYAVLTYASGDTIKPTVPSSSFSVSPAWYITTNAATTGNNFGVRPNATVQDLSLDLTTNTVFLWLATNSVTATVKNNGTTSLPAQVVMVLDTSFRFAYSSPLPDSVKGDTLFYSTDTIDILQSRTITVGFDMINDSLFDTVTVMAYVAPIAGDATPQNNYAIIRDAVFGSFDPNDKTCVQGDLITPTQVAQGQELDYVVRFQNTGNYPATNVVVTDTLSPMLNWSTFHIISSSHPVSYNLTSSGAVTFYFNHIELPPSSTDEPGSHGFVKYAVNCNSNLNLNDNVANTAFIYFDNNPAIVTNTATTTVGIHFVTAVESTGNEVTLKAYPNPTTTELNIELNQQQNATIEIYNAIGSRVATEHTGGLITTINTSSLAGGMYFGSVVTSSGQRLGTFRFVKQ